MRTEQRLLVLGAGTAGTMVANKVHRRLPDWRVTLVAKNDVHDYQPGYLFIPFGLDNAHDVRRTEHEFVSDGVQMLLGEVHRVDPDLRTVFFVDGRELEYDYLVIATGTVPLPDQTPGMLGPEWHRSVGEFYTLEGAQALADRLRSFTGGRLVVHVTEMPIKCPVAPLEVAFLTHDLLTKRGLRDRTELVFVTPLDGAFTKPVASRRLGHELTDRGIAVETDFMLESVDQGRRVITSYDDREVSFDLLVTVPVNMGADFVGRSGLGDELNYVPVDKHTMQSVDHPEIFALGDANDIPTSKAGSVAHFSVEVFIENLVELAQGKRMSHLYDGHANCFVET